jgi:hypothetical protein
VADEAATRLQAHGPNELRSLPPVPLWRRALAQLRDPLVYLLAAAAAWPWRPGGSKAGAARRGRLASGCHRHRLRGGC